MRDNVDNKMKKLLANSSYAIGSNLLNLIVTSLVVLVLPKLIGVAEYGYWQLYLFYVSYVGFGHLGWVDGLYLRYGGSYYRQLDKPKFFSQFVSYTIFQAIVSILVLLFFTLFIQDGDKIFIGQMLFVTLFLTNLRFFPIYLLQTTNRIKSSAKIIMLDRILYVLLLLLFIFAGVRNYQVMIFADIMARLLSLAYGIYLCQDILVQPLSTYRFDSAETKHNISIGISLMLSNIASLLIIGIVRMGIENHWDVVTFANISLTLSISNLMMLFINAIGVVVFPMIKRMREDILPKLYQSVRELLMAFIFGLFFCYFPIEILFQFWLPQYQHSLNYLPILFPLVAFEGKMALLLNTYLKAYRMERKLFMINALTAGLSLLLTYMTTVLLNDLTLSVFGILVLMMIRSALAEYFLAKRMMLNLMSHTILDTIVAGSFALIRWHTNLWLALCIYTVIFMLYMILRRKAVTGALGTLKTVLKK